VMCHRLKESRIATKRFGSQSPIQSFQTHTARRWKPKPSANQHRPTNHGRCCARCDADSPGDLEPHRVILESPFFHVETNQRPKRHKVRLFDA
jgi:hypothetical protein